MKGTISGRDAFLKRVAVRLGRDEPAAAPPARPFIGVPQFYRDRRYNREQNIELFVANWTALGGKALLTDRDRASQDVRLFLKSAFAEHGVSRVTRWQHEGLIRLGLDEWMAEEGIGVVPWKSADAAEAAANESGSTDPARSAPSGWSRREPLLQAAETCGAGIVWADYAIANTGTLALFARGGKGRSVSLLPDLLVGVFYADQLVTRMGDVFAGLATEYPGFADLPSSINFVTGPSRSADIENDLTIGVHGPGKVYAIIIR